VLIALDRDAAVGGRPWALWVGHSHASHVLDGCVYAREAAYVSSTSGTVSMLRSSISAIRSKRAASSLVTFPALGVSRPLQLMAPCDFPCADGHSVTQGRLGKDP
jgi:hypothetical protein